MPSRVGPHMAIVKSDQPVIFTVVEALMGDSSVCSMCWRKVVAGPRCAQTIDGTRLNRTRVAGGGLAAMHEALERWQIREPTSI